MSKPKNLRSENSYAGFAHEADVDYLLARKVNFLGGGFFNRAGFLAQQACEKYLKAWLIQESQEYLEVHSLIKLMDHALTKDPNFGYPEMETDLRTFDAFDQVGRYGGMAKFDPYAQTFSTHQVKGVSYWSDGHIEYLDRFVYYIRGKIDWVAEGWTDAFVPILKGYKKGHILIDTWNDKQPLVVVLTKQNRYFKRQ